MRFTVDVSTTRHNWKTRDSTLIASCLTVGIWNYGIGKSSKIVTVLNAWHVSKIYKKFKSNCFQERPLRSWRGPCKVHMLLIVCLFTLGILNYGIANSSKVVSVVNTWQFSIIYKKLKSNCFQERPLRSCLILILYWFLNSAMYSIQLPFWMILQSHNSKFPQSKGTQSLVYITDIVLFRTLLVFPENSLIKFLYCFFKCAVYYIQFPIWEDFAIP